MNFEFWYTLVLFVLLTLFLIREIFPPEITIFGALILLLVGEIISIDEAFSGFSNEGMLTIGFLFIIAGAIRATGIIDNLINNLLGSKQSSLKNSLIKLLIPFSFLSSFLNNTPLVAISIPAIKKWTAQNNHSISKFLIPISYVTILGGMCTLVGTSTNLIVHGLMIESGNAGFSFFELSYIGIPLTIAGILYITFFSQRILPNKKSAIKQLSEHTREYVIELKVDNEYSGIGKTIEDAGLRHLAGLFLFQIERNNNIISPAEPNEILLEEDRLFFTGLPETILELQKTPGLSLLKDSHFDLKNYDSDKILTYEVVISHSSPLLNVKVKDSNFRKKYNAVIIAIHRNGERIKKKIGEITLSVGDTLLLLSDSSFKNRWYNSKEFYLVSKIRGVESKPKWQAYFSMSIFCLLLVLAIVKAIPLVTAVGAAALVLIVSSGSPKEKIISFVDWKVLVIIASSFGIAKAVSNSGVGEYFANVLINFGSNFGLIGLITAMYLITAVYTNFITNNTAAVLLFPIALSLSSQLNYDLHVFAIAIAVGASSSFATPISYQTNLMVYGPGGYKYTDFMKFGIPLQLIVFLITIPIIYFFYL